jgi:hypothetical protein
MSYNPFIKAIAVAWQELTSDEAKAYYQRRAKEDRERLAAIRDEIVAIAKDVKAIVDEFREGPEVKEVECAIVGQIPVDGSAEQRKMDIAKYPSFCAGDKESVASTKKKSKARQKSKTYLTIPMIFV